MILYHGSTIDIKCIDLSKFCTQMAIDKLIKQ